MLISPTLVAIATAVVGVVALWIWSSRPLKFLPGLPYVSKTQSLLSILIFGPTNHPDNAAYFVIRQQTFKVFGRFAKLGNLVQYYFRGKLRILTLDPGLIRVILGDPYGFIKESLVLSGLNRYSASLFSIEGNDWKRHRKAMTPAFDQRHLELVVKSAVQKNKEIAKTLGQSTEVELGKTFSRITLDVLGIIMYSYDFKCTTTEDPPAMKAISEIFSEFQWLFILPSLIWHLSPSRRRFMAARQRISSTIAETIAAKKDDNKGEDHLMDMIDILLHESDLSQAEILDEAMGLFFAGYETSSSTIGWTVYYILTEPGVLEKVLVEIHHVIGTGDPSLSSLAKMRFLDSVIKETMRLAPAVTTTSRINLEPFQHNGTQFPKHCTFILSLNTIHKHPDYFKDPERFWPERWENAEEWLVPGTYLPFLDGPRRCIGEKMAMLEIKTTLVMFLRTYDVALLPDQDLSLHYGLILDFKDGLKVKLSPREGVKED